MLFDISEKIINIKNEDGTDSGATVKVKPLNVGDYQRLITLIKSFAVDDSTEKSESQAAIDGLDKLSDEKVSGIIKELLPKYCYDLKGVEVRDESGIRNATMDDFEKYGALYALGFKLLIELITVSTSSGDDKKK